MPTVLIRYYTEIVGLIGVLTVAIRLTFKIGAMITMFAEHCKQSDKTHADMDADIRELRARRK